MAKKIKILFQGDSITDAGRDSGVYYDLGDGYVKYAAEYIRSMYPSVEFEFINRGVSESKIRDLHPRLERDIIDIQPDIFSILIGVNDTWDYAKNRNWQPNELFEKDFRTVLDAVRTRTNARIMILEPFLFPNESKDFFREDLDFKIDVVRKLAFEYADVFLPTDGLLRSRLIGKDPADFAPDGVHLTPFCAQLLAGMYAEHISPIIDKLIK